MDRQVRFGEEIERGDAGMAAEHVHRRRDDAEVHLRDDLIEQRDDRRAIAQPCRRAALPVDEPLDAPVHEAQRSWCGGEPQGPAATSDLVQFRSSTLWRSAQLTNVT